MVTCSAEIADWLVCWVWGATFATYPRTGFGHFFSLYFFAFWRKGGGARLVCVCVCVQVGVEVGGVNNVVDTEAEVVVVNDYA